MAFGQCWHRPFSTAGLGLWNPLPTLVWWSLSESGYTAGLGTLPRELLLCLRGLHGVWPGSVEEEQ